MLYMDTDTARTVGFITGRMFMNANEITDTVRKANKVVMPIFEYLDTKDQMIVLDAINTYAEKMKPVVDKYDDTKTRKFIMRRIEE